MVAHSVVMHGNRSFGVVEIRQPSCECIGYPKDDLNRMEFCIMSFLLAVQRWNAWVRNQKTNPGVALWVYGLACLLAA